MRYSYQLSNKDRVKRPRRKHVPVSYSDCFSVGNKVFARRDVVYTRAEIQKQEFRHGRIYDANSLVFMGVSRTSSYRDLILPKVKRGRKRSKRWFEEEPQTNQETRELDINLFDDIVLTKERVRVGDSHFTLAPDDTPKFAQVMDRIYSNVEIPGFGVFQKSNFVKISWDPEKDWQQLMSGPEKIVAVDEDPETGRPRARIVYLLEWLLHTEAQTLEFTRPPDLGGACVEYLAIRLPEADASTSDSDLLRSRLALLEDYFKIPRYYRAISEHSSAKKFFQWSLGGDPASAEVPFGFDPRLGEDEIKMILTQLVVTD